MIVWKIHLDEEGTTTPVLDLLPKVPEQGNLSHFRPWLWQWNCSSQSPTRQTHPNSALHLLCHLQGLTEPVCLQAPCFSPLQSWAMTSPAVFVLQWWSRGWRLWGASLEASGACSGSLGSRRPSRTWSQCWPQRNECHHYWHQVAISKVVLIKIVCYTVYNFIEYKH